MSAITVSFSPVQFNNSNKKAHSAWTYIEDAREVHVKHWDVQRSFTKTDKQKEVLALKNKLFLNFRYYPLLSISMLAPTIMSATLLLAYWAFDAVTINPGILLWSLIGFGGMYIVLISASREIYGAEKQAN